MGERHYGSRRAYQQSKLADTSFGLELDRRLRAARRAVISLLAHPGVSRSNLARNGATRREVWTVRILSAMIAQPTAAGVLPQLRAATDPEVLGGQFYGPTGPGEIRGAVGLVDASAQARDPASATRLWAAAEALTGVRFLTDESNSVLQQCA